jgi:hypothetical protein
VQWTYDAVGNRTSEYTRYCTTMSGGVSGDYGGTVTISGNGANS